MLKNYHTHTSLCRHAVGTMEEYVKAAIDGGLQVLGFSDHIPVIGFPDDYYSSWRMRPEELPIYVQMVRSLQEKYKDKILIRLGFEMEYYPDCFEKTLRFLEQASYDYLILGQHAIYNEYDGTYANRPGMDECILQQSVKQAVQGMKTGVFSCLAHPDLCGNVVDDERYRQIMQPLLETALEMDIPLECNLLGVRDRRHYPTRRFFEIAAEYGCKVILGVDAHDPDALRNHEDEREALQLLAECGVTNIVEDIRLKGD